VSEVTSAQPTAMKNFEEYRKPKYMYVNEVYALFAGILILMSKTNETEPINDDVWSKLRDLFFWNEFLYLFRNRDVNPKHLFLTLEFLCKHIGIDPNI
jgi:hypothetical protein